MRSNRCCPSATIALPALPDGKATKASKSSTGDVSCGGTIWTWWYRVIVARADMPISINPASRISHPAPGFSYQFVMGPIPFFISTPRYRRGHMDSRCTGSPPHNDSIKGTVAQLLRTPVLQHGLGLAGLGRLLRARRFHPLLGAPHRPPHALVLGWPGNHQHDP